MSRNPGRPWRASFGKYVPAKIRRAVRREEHRQRPAARAPRHQRVRGLVDLVEVGPLLAIDLDVDEARRSSPRRRRILERFVRHHVAPVARRVADRQQDRLVLGRARESSASSPHGYQSTGLSACCRRYGLVALARRLAIRPLSAAGGRVSRGAQRRSKARIDVLERDALEIAAALHDVEQPELAHRARLDRAHASGSALNARGDMTSVARLLGRFGEQQRRQRAPPRCRSD